MKLTYASKDVDVVCHYNEKGKKGRPLDRLQIRVLGDNRDEMIDASIGILKFLQKKFHGKSKFDIFKGISIFDRRVKSE